MFASSLQGVDAEACVDRVLGCTDSKEEGKTKKKRLLADWREYFYLSGKQLSEESDSKNLVKSIESGDIQWPKRKIIITDFLDLHR